jgi:hypothetical protein
VRSNRLEEEGRPLEASMVWHSEQEDQPLEDRQREEGRLQQEEVSISELRKQKEEESQLVVD